MRRQLLFAASALLLSGCVVHTGKPGEDAPFWWPSFIVKEPAGGGSNLTSRTSPGVDDPHFVTVGGGGPEAVPADKKPVNPPPIDLVPVQFRDPLLGPPPEPSSVRTLPQPVVPAGSGSLYPTRGQAALETHSATLYPPTGRFNTEPGNASVYNHGPLPAGFRGP